MIPTVNRLIPTSLLLLLLLSACATTRDPPRTGGVITFIDEDDPASPFVIKRSALDDALERGPSWFIRQVRVQPVLLGESFYGFRLRAIFPDYPEFAEDAIRAGDIVQRVNGMPIERPDQFMTAWESLAEASHLSVRVVRDGKALLVTWLIEDDREPTPQPPVTSARR